jgi:cystathionine beta-synthase
MQTVSPATADIKDSILDAVGDTPLVRLSRLGSGLRPQLVAKIEALNPGGSIKDRAALALIEAAERDGSLRPGGTIVEPTSGNTGTGLAMAASLKGYRVMAVMPDKMSKEKIDLLRAYGAEVVVAPTDVPPDSPESYYRVADRLTEEIPGAFQPNQYRNMANPEAHYRTTGPELWRQSGGQITHLVAGVGTGGTITGVGQVLKERRPDITVIAVEPAASPVLSGGQPGPHKIQGIGAGFVPDVLDREVVDEVVTISDEDALDTAREAARREGLLIGISAGAAVRAALDLATREEMAGKRIVAIVPDSGERYMSLPFFAPA